MRRKILLACLGALFCSTAALAQEQPWESPYSGADATGPNVIALWHFDGNGADASGRKHDATPRGKDTTFVADGKFSGALQVEENHEPGDTRQGVATKVISDLNPAGAFTIEMWISPSEQLAGKSSAFLLDKKYFNYKSDKAGANMGYMLGLRKSGSDQFTLQAGLGFGDDSDFVSSMPFTLEAEKWYHVAFSYDGQGQCNFYLNAERVGHSLLKGRGAVSPSNYPVVIGDRVGSSGQRFYGRIDEVRLLSEASRYVSGKVLLETAGSRTTYYRMEKEANVKVKVHNDTFQTVKNATLQISADGITSKSFAVPELAPDKSTSVTLPLNTNLRPDTYEVTATVKSADLTNSITFPFTVVARPLPHQMPIIMWAFATKDYKQLTDIGYTGQLVALADYTRIWKDGNAVTSLSEDRTLAMRQQLDEMMAAGVGGLGTLTPGRYVPDEYKRKDRSDKIIDNADGLYPEVQQYSYNTGAAVARTFGDMPGWHGSLIHTEIRDHTAPSFNDIDRKAYRDYSGKDIPSQVASSRGVNYRAMASFPANRIISDDDPILTYYKWFWKEGDAWNTLNSKVNDGLKSTGRKDIFTWFDPAVRVPSIWGSGGNVDYLNQWTYTYPDPLKNDLATNELFAMASGRPGQKVMNMIQIIWYRTGTTAAPIKGQEAEWEKVTPDAKFISIAPDHLSEATWLQLAYPVSAIANHGWGSLGDTLGFKQGSYETANVETRQRMTELFQNVVKPLAPTLLQVPDYKTDVAFLESFASQMFAGTGTYGWGGGWGADSYMVARYAGLQPQIIYDESIQKNGLDQYKVLFLTDCPVLTKSVADAITKFQQRGGIVIGDEDLAPGIQPDILLSKVRRDKPKETKEQLLKSATALRQELDSFYLLPTASSNPDVITRLRQYGTSQYVFTINDNRTYGDYVGQHKKVMEKGLPAQAQITLNTRPGGMVYDLTNHRQVPTTKIAGKVQFPVNLGAGQGNLFLVTDKPVGKLQISAPASAKRDGTIAIKVLLPGNDGKTLNAIIPLQVTIRDAKGRIAEKSGYYGAKDGQLNIDLDIAPNDAAGKWQIEVTEALTGQKNVRDFTVG